MNSYPNKIQTYIKYIFFYFLAVLVMVTFILYGTSSINTPPAFELTSLENDYTITVNDVVLESTDLTSADLGVINKGDIVTITTTVPQDPVPGSCLAFRSILSTVNVLINDKIIYSYGQDYAAKNMMLPKHYNYVSIDPEYAGSLLTITFSATENSAFSGISEIYFGNVDDYSTYFFQKEKINFIIGDFLSVFGLVQLILFITLRFSKKSIDASLLFSCMISFSLGGYILCYNDVFPIISSNDYVFTCIEYISLYFIPPSIIGFLIVSGQEFGIKISKLMCLIDYIFVAVVSFLHFTGISHYNNFVTTMHVIALIEGLYSIFVLVHSFIKKLKSPDRFEQVQSASVNALLAGLLIFLVFSIIDLIKFDFMKYVASQGESRTNVSFVTVGALSFVICLVINYFLHITEHINEITIKTKLQGLAYKDSLTGISNRARCEQVQKELSESSKSFCIISIDLDRLKYVNDTFGHLSGDKMIADFAHILSDVFPTAILVGRMGGDEFIVIIDTTDQSLISMCLDKLKTAIDKRNDSSKDDPPISASIGYALRTLPSQSCHDIYMEADNNMIIQKQLNHRLLSPLDQQKGGENR